MREIWSRIISERAAAYWTDERVGELTGGKVMPLSPVAAAPLLRALGLMNGDASIPPRAARKYLQINHIVILLELDLVTLIDRFGAGGAPIRLVDAACGRSYLSHLLAWCFVHRWQHPVEILGIDRNPRVIATCRRRLELSGLPPVLRYEAAALDDCDVGAAWQRAFGAAAHPHAVLALHACDTASDAAIALGVALGADMIAVAPCCQAELAQKWAALAAAGAAGAFAPVWGSPHLRRELGASVTDALRTLLMRGAGYDVVAMQFVPSAHTPKNTLLRGHRRAAAAVAAPAARAAYQAMRDATGGAGIWLADALAGID